MNKRAQNTHFRPPIVAVLGHVDHGKTTLLDAIRKTAVAAREHGGITQHIGAYQVTVKDSKSPTRSEDHVITFIDTPGHEAFAAMRSRGASVADIALLVVAANDSVKPQTVESIEQIKAAGASMIVVINKIDLPVANIDKAKSDLARAGVQVEGFGGDVPEVAVSAKAGTGIQELLDVILLVWQMKGVASEPASPLEAVVIETRVDKGKGMVATVIVKKGTLGFGTELFDRQTWVGRVRAMFDEHGKAVSCAGPSKPVEVLGCTMLPAVGSVLHASPNVPAGAPSAEAASSGVFSADKGREGMALPDWLKPVEEQEKTKLNIVLKTDTAGSLEAIRAALSERIRVVRSGIGDITDADVLLAKSAKAFIVGFNVRCAPHVAKLAEAERVVYRTYRIIYELLDELAEVVEGLKEVLTQERELGAGIIIAEFPYETQRVLGTKVIRGRFARGDKVKVMRGDTEVGRARIKSLRVRKDEVTKVDEGLECGILLDKSIDFQLEDAIIAVTTG